MLSTWCAIFWRWSIDRGLRILFRWISLDWCLLNDISWVFRRWDYLYCWFLWWLSLLFRWGSVFSQTDRLFADQWILLFDRRFRYVHWRGLRHSHLLKNIVHWLDEVAYPVDCRGRVLLLLVGPRLLATSWAFLADGELGRCVLEALLIVHWLDLSFDSTIIFVFVSGFGMSRLGLAWFLIMAVLLVWMMVMLIVIMAAILPFKIFSG